MGNIFDEFDKPPEQRTLPPQYAPPVAAPAAPTAPNVFDQFDAPSQPPAVAPGGIDWSQINKPLGELKPATSSPTQQLTGGIQDFLLAHTNASPYNASKLANIATTGASMVPVLGSAMSGVDLPYDVGRGAYGHAALDVLGLAPGGLALKRIVRGAPTIPMADVPKLDLSLVGPSGTPGVDTLKTAVTKSYDAVRNSPVVYHPSAIDDLVSEARIALTKRGLNPVKAPSTFSILDTAGAPKPPGAIVTPDDFDTLRQQLRGGVPGTQDKLAGGLAIELLDRRMANPLPQHIISGTRQDISDLGRNLSDARGNYRALATAKAVEGKIDTSAIKAAITNSGGNLDNTTRQYLASLVTTKAGQRAIPGATAAEKQAIEDAAKGDWLTNAQRYGGKLLGGGGGLGQFVASSTGGGIGTTLAHMFGADPVTATGIGALSSGAAFGGGVALRASADARTRLAAENVADMIRRNSPEYAARMARTPPVIDPLAMHRDAIAYALTPQIQNAGKNLLDQAYVPYANREPQ
jgi:hypothetical protein